MRRRALPEEPIAAAAEWSRLFGAFAVVLAVFGILLGRSGVVGGWGGVAVLAAALVCAVAALGLAARAAVVIWQTGLRGSARALAGCCLASVVLAYPAYLAVAASRLPVLNDVSTDLVAPPSFSTLPAARVARGGFTHADPPAEVRDAQRRAYPDVQPVLLDLSPSEAYQLALKIVSARRWQILERTPLKAPFGVGRIDAVAKSRIMGFPEDVTLRIRPEGGQSRIDIRSASRLERHDIGNNAARIESLADDLQNAE